MAIERFTVNVPPSVGEALERRAEADKRSVSNYVSLLVEKDLREAGELASDGGSDEILKASKELGADESLKILRRAIRRKETAA